MVGPLASIGGALICNTLSIRLLLPMSCGNKRRRPAAAAAARLLLPIAGATLGLTAIQHWMAHSDVAYASDFGVAAARPSSPNLSMSLELVRTHRSYSILKHDCPHPLLPNPRPFFPFPPPMQQSQLLTLASCQAMTSTLRGPWIQAVLAPLLLLLPLAQLDALAAAVVCSAFLALQAATLLAPSLEGRADSPPASFAAIIPFTAPTMVLLWIPLLLLHRAHDEDEWSGSLSLRSAESWWPDTGMWWYMMTEAFQGFQSYFHLVSVAHPFLYLAPMAIRVAGAAGKGRSSRREKEGASMGREEASSHRRTLMVMLCERPNLVAIYLSDSA